MLTSSEKQRMRSLSRRMRLWEYIDLLMPRSRDPTYAGLFARGALFHALWDGAESVRVKWATNGWVLEVAVFRRGRWEVVWDDLIDVDQDLEVVGQVLRRVAPRSSDGREGVSPQW